MTNRPGRTALVEALAAPRRHLGALVLVAAAFGGAWLVGTDGAYYTAWLVAFAVWMGWFVLTAVAWIRRADF